MRFSLGGVALALLAWGKAEAFVTVRPNAFTQSSSLSLSSSDNNASKNIVIISPPSGIGEVSAVEAAKRGASVRWFVVGSSSKVSFSEASLAEISAAGGNIELAGSDPESLLLAADDSNSAVSALTSWCGKSDAMISCLDLGEDEKSSQIVDSMDTNELVQLENAVKVATLEASKSCSGVKVAVSSVRDLEDDMESEESEGGGILSSIFGRGVTIPKTVGEAMGSSCVNLRYGNLFGQPTSSKEASPFLGGPRRDPILRDEYTNRAIRIDPSVSVYANPALSSQTRSSRLSLGEAASLVALKAIPSKPSTDLCIASLRGSDILSEEEWNTEFTRVAESTAQSAGASSTVLFTTDFGSVPNIERLADWLGTKWAPAILRTYDIAGIRVGARPVYASRTSPNSVEIVWQQLVNFESKTVGKMKIDVSDSGWVASRIAGDASQGFGKVSLKPLSGEDILIRSLADAASQAVEKGLATKSKVKKAKKTTETKAATTIQQTSTVVSSGSVPPTASAPSVSSGPRSGASRSSERSRGSRKKKASPPPSNIDSEQGFQ